jgi:hypothetical protein
MKLNREVAIRSIGASTEKIWLGSFRDRMAPVGETEIVSAIDRRLIELNQLQFRHRVGPPLPASASLVERVQEALRVYEEGLALKHGRRQPAGRLRPMIMRWGEKETVRRTVANLDMSTGLEVLDQMKRLDCAFEQIILDFPEEYGNDPKLIEGAGEPRPSRADALIDVQSSWPDGVAL